MKRKLLCLITVLALLCCQIVPAFAEEYEPSFWAEEAVKKCTELSIIPEIYNTKSFQSYITRLDFINIAVNLYATITAENVHSRFEHPFLDTKDPFPNMAYYAGFVSGDGEGHFFPRNTLTRQEMCKVVTSLLDAAGVLGPYFPSEGVFDNTIDADQVADWAYNHVAFMLDNNLMAGDEDGAFRPTDPITREEVAIIAYRCFVRYGPEVNGQIKTALRLGKDTNNNTIQILTKTITLPSGTTVPLSEANSYNQPSSYVPVGNNGKAPSGTPFATKGDDGLYPLKTYSETLADGTAGQKEARIFGNSGRYISQQDADANMSEVTVNVWKVDDNGEYYASTLTFKINSVLKDDVIAIFDEIFKSPYKAPIKDVSAYAWRSSTNGGSFSDHNYGTAIDLNYNENYCIYASGTQVGSFYDPENSIYSFPKDGIVVQTFAKYGWLWGGNAWVNGTVDHMHFTYLGK